VRIRVPIIVPEYIWSTVLVGFLKTFAFFRGGDSKSDVAHA